MVDYVGRQLGNYRLTRLLGEGGFAEVYLGEHIHLKTRAAIKVQRTVLTEEDREQFRREAQTVANLDHPNIVRVLEFGVEGDTLFLVMSYAPNNSLRQRHPKGTVLPLPTVVSYVKQIADALQFAHDQKLMHLDIKPENMLVGSRNEILLSDFGLATVSRSTRSTNMEDKSVVGTALYMAPEQFRNKSRPASDQYALAIVVYEWLCGAPPFSGNFLQLAYQHRDIPPSSLREENPALPSVVEQVVLKALAKDPHERFAGVQEFAKALEDAYKPPQPKIVTEPSSGTSRSRCPYCRTSIVQKDATFCPTCGTRLSSAESALLKQSSTQIDGSVGVSEKQPLAQSSALPPQVKSKSVDGNAGAPKQLPVTNSPSYAPPPPTNPYDPYGSYAPPSSADPYSGQQYGQGYGQSRGYQPPDYGQPPSYGQSASYQPPNYQPYGYGSYHQYRSSGPPDTSQRVAAGLSYMFSWISGLIVVFFVAKQNRFVRFHSMQSILFFGSTTVLQLVVALLLAMQITWLTSTLSCITGLLTLVYFVSWIALMICGFQGKYFKMPIFGDIAERYADRGTM